MNVMTRIVNSLPTYWEVFKSYLSPGSREESEEEASDEPPSKRRRTETDHFLLGVTTPGIPNDTKKSIHPLYENDSPDDFLLGFHDRPYSYPVKLKRKSRLESPVVSNTSLETGNVGKENVVLIDIEKNGKENGVAISGEHKSEKEGAQKSSSLGEKPAKPELKVIDLTNADCQNASTERATWLDARTTCRLFTSNESRANKENDSQQLKVVVPSLSEKQNLPLGSQSEFRGKLFSAAQKQHSKTGMSGGGISSSLKRPSSNSLSSLCSTRSSSSGRKLQLLDQSIRLDEREKYSELLQSYIRVPVMKHSAHQTRHDKSPPISFVSRTRKRYGNTVEVIDLTHQPESKDEAMKSDGMLGSLANEASGIAKPTPSGELRRKLEKCNVYDVSWIEELTKMYNRKDRETRKRIMEEKLKAALCTQKSEQLLHEILEEKVRVHLRLTEVAVEEGPVPIAEDEEPLPELTPEIEKRVAYAFKSGPGGEVLSEAFSLRITRRDMHTLVGTNWLNDEVINFYMNLLIERGKLDNYPSVYCFNTFFYPKLESQGHTSLKRWTRRVDVFANELLIVPVHLGVHWCLSCVNLKEKRILYYDSMGGRNNTCLQTLLKYLQDECMDKKRQKFDTTGWSLENIKDNPQQMNGSDCGMFSCMYAEYLCRKAKITFSQSDMPYFRRKMAYEIITKKLML